MRKFITTALVVIVFGSIAYTLAYGFLDKYIFMEMAPKQPINFSHKIHAGDNEIPCQQCHIYARRSRVSGVPSVQRCMGCHKTVRIDSPEIKKLHSYWNSEKPIPWIKVHDVPDYVYFTHKRHIKRGLRCQECHGAVETMDIVERQFPIAMSWCLNCHKSKNPPGPADCWECHI